MGSYRLRFVPARGACRRVTVTVAIWSRRGRQQKKARIHRPARDAIAENAERAAYMDLKDEVDEAPAESSRRADDGASGKEPRSTGSEAQATHVARRSQGRRGVAAAGRAQHLPERACTPVRSFVGVHVAAGGRDSQPLAARAQAYSAGAGNNGLRRAVRHRARGRLAGLPRRSNEIP